MTYRLGVDVGGTFTDLVLFDELSGRLTLAKTPSTPTDPSVGVAQGVAKVAARAGIRPADIGAVVHGTTVATNALLERRGAACALIVTEGFRDVLHIGRQDRPKLYEFLTRRPEPLVPRHRRFEVRERMLPTGEVLAPLDDAQVLGVIEAIRRQGVGAVAVCLLHSYANPEHERRLGELLRRELPGVAVCLSSEVLPEFKEFERMSTTVVTAYLVPLVEHYLGNLLERVSELGFGGMLHVMQSNGGLMTADVAARRSAHLVLSGPAAGVIGAVQLATWAGLTNVISVDMGGTSFDICLAADGEVRLTQESEVAGCPIKLPMVDVHTLGAGGGSIAWVDHGGALRVGPRSAGADPGPACYGRGGELPTVTDANLVLGRLSPEQLLGGELQLDVEASRRAIEASVARPLDLTVEAAAEGIVRVINATMVKGMRLVSVARGHDPREFVLVAFGGGGPLHAVELAEELGLPQVLVPVAPGVTSALGLLLADFRHDRAVTHLRNLAEVDPRELEAMYAGLEQDLLTEMRAEGLAPAQVTLLRTADLRYHGQGYELETPAPPGPLDRPQLRRLHATFRQIHERVYGYAPADDAIDVINVRVTAIGRVARPERDGRGTPDRLRRPRPSVRRRIYTHGEWVDAGVFVRDELQPGDRIAGPCIVEQLDSTTLLLPGHQVSVDAGRNLLINLRPTEDQAWP